MPLCCRSSLSLAGTWPSRTSPWSNTPLLPLHQRWASGFWISLFQCKVDLKGNGKEACQSLLQTVFLRKPTFLFTHSAIPQRWAGFVELIFLPIHCNYKPGEVPAVSLAFSCKSLAHHCLWDICTKWKRASWALRAQVCTWLKCYLSQVQIPLARFLSTVWVRGHSTDQWQKYLWML